MNLVDLATAHNIRHIVSGGTRGIEQEGRPNNHWTCDCGISHMSYWGEVQQHRTLLGLEPTTRYCMVRTCCNLVVHSDSRCPDHR